MNLLAIDWGSSSLRGALLDASGHALQERAFEKGILAVPSGQFEKIFIECFGDWLTPDTLCLISGMAGSRQGWQEAAYCNCPAGFDDIAAKLEWVEPGRIAIVPGLCTETEGIPDVMRGEETQIFGTLKLLEIADAVLALPGTHSKWVTVKNRQITGFSTWMTGEFYALLRWQSILAHTLPQEEPALDAAAFEHGFAVSQQGPGLLHNAFSTRTLSLFEKMDAAALPSYLSGLVVGEELKAQSLQRGSTVVVVGASNLGARYRQGLEYLDIAVKYVGAEATWLGLRAIADTLQT